MANLNLKGSTFFWDTLYIRYRIVLKNALMDFNALHDKPRYYLIKAEANRL